jgi:hypothetical protein
LLTGSGYTPDNASQQANRIVREGRLAHLDIRNLDSSAFFSVQDAAGVLFVTLNSNHPFYNDFFEVSKTPSSMSDSERIRRMRTAVEMLLFAWARMEDNASLQDTHVLLRIRQTWGTVAVNFLEQIDEHS